MPALEDDSVPEGGPQAKNVAHPLVSALEDDAYFGSYPTGLGLIEACLPSIKQWSLKDNPCYESFLQLKGDYRNKVINDMHYYMYVGKEKGKLPHEMMHVDAYMEHIQEKNIGGILDDGDRFQQLEKFITEHEEYIAAIEQVVNDFNDLLATLASCPIEIGKEHQLISMMNTMICLLGKTHGLTKIS